MSHGYERYAAAGPAGLALSAVNDAPYGDRRFVPHADAPASARAMRIGIIRNLKSHRNLSLARGDPAAPWNLFTATPRSQAALAAALEDFARRDIDLLVVDGGDGTVRDVLTHAARIFTRRLPRLAVLPSGKTNALAIDLGIPIDWTMGALLESVAADRFAERSPLEIMREGSDLPQLRGFLFGTGAFVRATELAQRTHKIGAFNGLAVGLSLAGAIGQTVLGSAGNPWRAGERMLVEGDGWRVDRAVYLLFGSTLTRLPLGLKPFGPERGGFKLLLVDAPPGRLLLSAPVLVAGSQAGWLKRAGFHRIDPSDVSVSMPGGFVLDGEGYPGGEFVIRRGAPLRFAVP